MGGMYLRGRKIGISLLVAGYKGKTMYAIRVKDRMALSRQGVRFVRMAFLTESQVNHRDSG